MALDLEDVNVPKLMNVREALQFIHRVHERTGRYPLVYATHSNVQLISTNFRGTDFSRTHLWYARYRSVVCRLPKGIWASYTVWQFSSEILAQIDIPGTQRDMDVSVYNGSREQIRSQWPLD